MGANIIVWALFPFVFGFLFYFLYSRGYIWINTWKRISLFSMPKYLKNGVGASFKYTTSGAKRVKIFKEDGIYLLKLELNRKKGDFTLRFLDDKRSPIFAFSNESGEKRLEVKSGEKYHIEYSASKFEGDFEFTWELL